MTASTLSSESILSCLSARLYENLTGPLVSLWDIVQHFNAYGFYEQLSKLTRWEMIASKHIDDGNGDAALKEATIRTVVSPLAADLSKFCQEIGLEESKNRLDHSFAMQFYAYGDPTWRTLNTEFRVLRESIESELSRRVFAHVSRHKAPAIAGLPDTSPWPEVSNAIPSAVLDISEASYCYALNRNTACVFHLMRVAAHCLRALARKLKVRLTHKGKAHAIEFADWDKVITGCKTAIQSVVPRARDIRRQRRLELYSEIAEHCLVWCL